MKTILWIESQMKSFELIYCNWLEYSPLLASKYSEYDPTPPMQRLVWCRFPIRPRTNETANVTNFKLLTLPVFLSDPDAIIDIIQNEMHYGDQRRVISYRYSGSLQGSTSSNLSGRTSYFSYFYEG